MIDPIIQGILDHITVLNDDYTRMSADVAVLQTQMAEILWLVKVIVVAFVGMLVTQFWQIVILRKNNK